MRRLFKRALLFTVLMVIPSLAFGQIGGWDQFRKALTSGKYNAKFPKVWVGPTTPNYSLLSPGDIMLDRGGSGALYFGGSTSHYISNGGSYFLMSDSLQVPGGIANTPISGSTLNATVFTPTLGTEKIAIDATCTGWTLGAGWACGGDGTVTKNGAGTGTAVYNASEASGESYQIIIPLTVFSAGTFTVTVGGSLARTVTSADGATQTVTQHHNASSTSDFTLTPTDAARFVIGSTLSIKKMTNGGTPLYNDLTMYGGQILAQAGSTPLPGFAFRLDPSTGFKYAGTGEVDLILNGTNTYTFGGDGYRLHGSRHLMWGSSGVVSPDLALTRLGAGQVSIGYSSNTSGNSQSTNIKVTSTLLTIASGTVTSTWSNGIPANSIVIGISSRVTTVIPSAATNYSVGIGGATTRYTNASLVAAGTTHPGTNDGLRAYTTATDVIVTTDGNPSDNTGRIRLTVHYIDITPPTS